MKLFIVFVSFLPLQTESYPYTPAEPMGVLKLGLSPSNSSDSWQDELVRAAGSVSSSAPTRKILLEAENLLETWIDYVSQDFN